MTTTDRVEKAMMSLRFKSTCREHRRMFVEALLRGGVVKPPVMEMARLRFILKAADKLTEAEMYDFLNFRCMGCAYPEWTRLTTQEVIAHMQRHYVIGR